MCADDSGNDIVAMRYIKEALIELSDDLQSPCNVYAKRHSSHLNSKKTGDNFWTKSNKRTVAFSNDLNCI